MPCRRLKCARGLTEFPLPSGILPGYHFAVGVACVEEVYRGLDHVSRVNTAETILKTQGMLRKGNMGSENTYRAIVEVPLGSVSWKICSSIRRVPTVMAEGGRRQSQHGRQQGLEDGTTAYSEVPLVRPSIDSGDVIEQCSGQEMEKDMIYKLI